MVKVLLEVPDEKKELLDLTEEQFRLLEFLKNGGWLDDFVEYETLKEVPFKKV